jgi:hypothetical protein
MAAPALTTQSASAPEAGDDLRFNFTATGLSLKQEVDGRKG